MFEFAELLTLAIATVLMVYLLSVRERLRTLPFLWQLQWPLLLLMVAWIATVIEGIPLGENAPLFVFVQENVEEANEAGTFSAVSNLIEHLALAGAAVWILVILVRRGRAPEEVRP
jgi:hypothetical protein